MIMIKTTTQNNNEILRRLDRIENLLLHIFKREEELTEDEALAIFTEGDLEYKKGETEKFDSFIAREHPNLIRR